MRSCDAREPGHAYLSTLRASRGGRSRRHRHSARLAGRRRRRRVALTKGASIDPDEVRDCVKAQVTAYKYPRRIWLLDELPKGATGKVQKRDITAPASENAP